MTRPFAVTVVVAGHALCMYDGTLATVLSHFMIDSDQNAFVQGGKEIGVKCIKKIRFHCKGNIETMSTNSEKGN